MSGQIRLLSPDSPEVGFEEGIHCRFRVSVNVFRESLNPGRYPDWKSD